MIPRKASLILKELLAQAKPVMILGARQVGKTTLVQSTLSESDSAYLNLDIATDKARLISLAALAPREAIAALAGNKPYLVIDEAQRWDGLGQVVKGWYDARASCKIVYMVCTRKPLRRCARCRTCSTLHTIMF
jgi:hypothetical protein